ncbi:MAG: hypothetical protein EU529_14815 [Promethearchaeota archaeon]|nr:MAG: hypothetical protein EU529_14815 [Candidatus Lokiarchaeota archaeon]
MNTLEFLFKNYRFSRQSYKYYFDRRIELKEIYNSELSRFDESLSLERIMDAFYAISSIEIDIFLTDFNQYLKDIPFTVNSRTILNFIDYYNLHWRVEEGVIINEDYHELHPNTQNILDKIIIISKRFSMIHIDMLLHVLASDFDLEPQSWDLLLILHQFKYYLISKGVRLEIRDDWVVNLDKI